MGSLLKGRLGQVLRLRCFKSGLRSCSHELVCRNDQMSWFAAQRCEGLDHREDGPELWYED